MDQKKKRYKKVKGQVGIREEVETGKFEAYKTVDGEKYFKQFDLISEAKKWRLNFVPEKTIKRASTVLFGHLLNLYIEEHIEHLATSTKGVKKDRMKIFEPLKEIPIEKMTAEFFINFFKEKKEESIKRNSRRKTFNEEIKDLKALFNWYKENIDYKFHNPIVGKRLKKIATIDPSKKEVQKMSMVEFNQFIEKLPELYKDLAIMQSRMAARIGEAAGLQFSSIDFKARKLTVAHVLIWDRKKRPKDLKDKPKNKDRRGCVITDDMYEVLQRRLSLKAPNSDYVFHIDGDPLTYRTIQHHYNKAIKDAGLSDRFSSTHFIRHTMAFFTRSAFNSLDYVQAVTGHKSSSLAEHYSGLPSEKQAEAMLEIERRLREEKNRVGKGGQE